MQIDFHYAVTYATARLAGFSIPETEIISYSAQFVDDAVSEGVIKFSNNAMYKRSSSAHKMLDYKNFEELANHFSWVPFHFLPGNGGAEAGVDPNGSFIKKLVCFPNSHVAHDMVETCIKDKDKPYALHRLGITMHVLADTFAHQGFAGVNHKINEVSEMVELSNGKRNLMDSVKNYFADLFDSVTNKFVSDVLPLGHGGALSYPDLPYLKWQYKNGLGEMIKRDNTAIFIDAVKAMHLAMVRFRKSDPLYSLLPEEEIAAADLDIIRNNFLKFNDKEGVDRNKKWLDSIKKSGFSFNKKGDAVAPYICDAKGSWKYQALGVAKEEDKQDNGLDYKPEFLTSNWKLFNDALQFHQIDMIRNILPRYGICVA